MGAQLEPNMLRGFKITPFWITEAQLLSFSAFALSLQSTLALCLRNMILYNSHQALGCHSLDWRATTGFFTPTCPSWCPPDARAAALSRQSVYSPPLSKGPNPPPQARFTPPPPPQLELMPEQLSCPAVLNKRGLSLRCYIGEVTL